MAMALLRVALRMSSLRALSGDVASCSSNRSGGTQNLKGNLIGSIPLQAFQSGQPGRVMAFLCVLCGRSRRPLSGNLGSSRFAREARPESPPLRPQVFHSQSAHSVTDALDRGARKFTILECA